MIEFACTKRIRNGNDRTAKFFGQTFRTPAQGAMFGERANADKPRVENLS